MSFELAEYSGGVRPRAYKSRAACVKASYAKKKPSYRYGIKHYGQLASTCPTYPRKGRQVGRRTVKRMPKNKLAYCAYRLPELKKIAQREGLVGRSKMNKADLCTALQNLNLIK